MINVKKLTLKDLRSLEDLKTWVRDNSNKFVGKDITKENMLIILDYLRETVKGSNLKDKAGWLSVLNTLKERQEVADG